MIFYLSAAILLFISGGSRGQLSIPKVQNSSEFIIFDPPELVGALEGTTQAVEWITTLPGAASVSYSIHDQRVNSVIGFNESFGEQILESNVTGNGFFNISSDFVGYNVINLTVYDESNQVIGVSYLKVSVLLSYQKLNKIFTYVLTLITFILYILMGATIDLEVVKGIAKRPVGPIVGIVCQYIFMPLIAYGIARLVFPDNELLQLGIFLSGASPGGGNSNVWTLLLGGSFDLSIMMTFVSTICAFAAVPIWVLTLGQKILGEGQEFVIPYANIGYIVLSLAIPCFIGLITQRYAPRVSQFMEKRLLGPVSLFNIIFIFTVGVYSHRYIFVLFTPTILWSAFLLPTLGYISGIVLSLLTRRSFRDTIAISIETGIQNTNIGMIILKFTLERPAGDLAVVMSACSVLMTPIIPVAGLLVKKAYDLIHSFMKGESTMTLGKGKAENGVVNNKLPSNQDQKELAKYSPNTGERIKYPMRDRLFGIDNPGMTMDGDFM